MADFIITDEGDFIAASAVKWMEVSGNILLIHMDANSQQNSITYNYASAAIANAQFTKYATAFGVAPASLTFTARSPATAPNNTVETYSITGTGFLLSGITNLRFINGGNNITGVPSINSDINMTIPEALTPVGSWTISYSLDGATFTPTGLAAIVVS